jgi:hypothetical protein
MWDQVVRTGWKSMKVNITRLLVFNRMILRSSLNKIMVLVLMGFIFGVMSPSDIVLADNGPHGDFSSNSDSCSICHRLQSSDPGYSDQNSPDPDDLCLVCHNGTGAGTNVVDGIYMSVGLPGDLQGDTFGSLMGGGFTNTLMSTEWTGKAAFDPSFNAISRSVTSSHELGNDTVVWGAGAQNSPTVGMDLKCISCHNPHGNAGWDVSSKPGESLLSSTYRLLRWQPLNSDGFSALRMNVNWSGGSFPLDLQVPSLAGWLVPDNYSGDEWYTIGKQGSQALGDYSTNNTNNTYLPNGFNYVSAAVNVSYFCAQCHDNYFNNRNLFSDNDESQYCGTPGTPRQSGATLLPTFKPDRNGYNSKDPANCLPVFDTAGRLTGWTDVRGSGDSNHQYRHDSGDVLRNSTDGTFAAQDDSTLGRSCLACHVAHGTSAVVDSAGDSSKLEAVGRSFAGDSALLRMDERTICLSCHLGDVGLTTGPAPETSHNQFNPLDGVQCARCHSIHSARQ